MLSFVLYYLQGFLCSSPHDVQWVVLIPVVLVSELTSVVVDYRKVNDAMRIFWNYLFMNPSNELDLARYEAWCEVWIPCLAISPVV